jgi:transcriptional regulator with XRE-family HTH domain
MFWSNFVRLCDSVGKAPNVVAAEVGVKSSGTVTGWKNGAAPRQAVLLRIADYFHVSVDDLTGEKEKPTAESGELAEKRKQIRDLIQQMDEPTLDKFIAVAEAFL